MVLELHIWGPAFGLPSIEAQCLATVAYFIQCLPAAEWRLIPSSDPSVNPTNGLPALRVDSEWISGFRGIVNFLRTHSSGKWNLDQNLDKQQQADSIAFTCFLESRGQPLLDLSLFVSSENYTEWTRPALAEILQWPQQRITPHRLRDEAKIRSEHLGLSSLDFESVNGKDGDTNVGSSGNIPKSLLPKLKETVASRLAKTGHQNQFRLDAVTSDFFESLCDMVSKNGSHSWVFGTDRASSLDCLLLGYMSLMSPPLLPPQKWFPDALSTKFPSLLEWTTNFRQECFGGPISAVNIVSLTAPNMPASYPDLPWHPRAPTSIENVSLTVLTATFDSLPLVSSYRSDRVIRSAPRDTEAYATGTAGTLQATKFPFHSGLGMAGSVLGTVGAYLLYVGFSNPRGSVQHPQNPNRRSNTTSRRDFGEAGRMLGLGLN